MGLMTRLANAIRGAKIGLSMGSIEKSGGDGISWVDQLRLFRGDRNRGSIFPTMGTRMQERSLKTNSVVFSCVTTKAKAFQQPPIVIEEYNAETETWAPNEDHELLVPFKDNPYLTENDLKWYISCHLNLTGKSFLWEWKDGIGNTAELWPIPPSWVTMNVVETIPDNPNSPRVIESFTVRPYQDSNSMMNSRGVNTIKEWEIPADEMSYIRFPDPQNLWDGLSPVSAACKGIYLDNKGDEYKGEAMDNLRLPGVVVKTKKPLSQTQKDDLRAVLRQKVGGDARENAVLISGDDAELDLLNPMENFDWASYSHLNETRICMVFGVPPIVIGSWVGLENSPWANTGEAKRWMYQNTMVSEWELVSHALSRSLIPEADRSTLRVSFDLSGIRELRDDINELWKRAREGWNDGMITRAEARELVGYESDDSDNVFKYGLTSMLVPADENPPMIEPTMDEGKHLEGAREPMP